MAPCKFAEKVWNAQEAGAQGVRKLSMSLPSPQACQGTIVLGHRTMLIHEHVLQVIVVNYEDKHTTMEAPDDQDEISYK